MPDLTPRTLDWIDTAPVRASATRSIPAPPDRVWAVIADHAAWPSWATRIDEVVPGPVASGIDGTRSVTIGPITVDERFIAWEPEHRFAFTLVRSNRGGLRSMAEDIRLVADGDHATTVTYVQALDVPGGRVVAPVLRPVLRRVIGEMLDGLADHVRAAPAP